MGKDEFKVGKIDGEMREIKNEKITGIARVALYLEKTEGLEQKITGLHWVPRVNNGVRVCTPENEVEHLLVEHKESLSEREFEWSEEGVHREKDEGE